MQKRQKKSDMGREIETWGRRWLVCHQASWIALLSSELSEDSFTCSYICRTDLQHHFKIFK